MEKKLPTWIPYWRLKNTDSVIWEIITNNEISILIFGDFWIKFGHES